MSDFPNDSLRAVLDVSGNGYWDWPDPTRQRELWLSNRFYQLLGYQTGDFPATVSWFEQAIHPEDRHEFRASLEAHLQDRQALDIVCRIKTRDGSYRWFHIYGRVIPDEHSRATRMSGSIEDITEHKLYQDAVHHLVSGIATHTGASYLESLALELCRLFDIDYALIGLLAGNNGQRIETIAACAHGQIVENVSYDLHGTPCAEVIGATPCTFRTHVREKFPEDHMLRDMGAESYIGIPLFTSDGDALGLMALLDSRPIPDDSFIVEITQLFADRAVAEIERVQSESELQIHREHLQDLVAHRTEELNRVIKELESFSYSVSHDLRAPLRAINGFSEALYQDYADKLDDTAKDFLQRICCGANRMGELIDDLLVLSRVTRHQIHRAQVNLSELAQDILQQLQQEQPQRKLSSDIQADIVASGDPSLIRIVMENLLGNAWKYTSKNEVAEIRFFSRADNGTTAYVIEDNGSGFNMEYVDRVFEVFQRLHRAEDFEGTGIGLATVKRIIDRHGGSIWAESKIGEGTSFYFTLPEPQRPARGL